LKLNKTDNLDVKILSNLLNNCRESDRQIGQKIGLSGVAVRSRIDKMLRLNLIEKFTLKIEPHLLGYNVIYLVTTGQDVNEIIKQVKLVGEPFFVVPCVGGYSACGIVVKGEVEQKIAIIKNLLKQVRILNIFEAEDAGIESDLTKTDLDVIEQLLKNPREQIDAVAKNAKISSKTVARSITLSFDIFFALSNSSSSGSTNPANNAIKTANPPVLIFIFSKDATIPWAPS